MKTRVVKLALPWVIFGVLLLAPAFGLGANVIRLLFITCIWVTTSLAWNLLGGFAGQVSFGFAVFYGIGAYVAALLIDKGINPYLSFVVAGLAAAFSSFLVGLPTFRLRGPYFAIATIGVSETIRVIADNLSITGGASGFRIVENRPFHQVEHYYTALGMAAFAVVVSTLIEHSKFGLGLVAIRHDEDAAADIGVNPFRYKLWAHAVAAALTGMAGGVFARYAAYIHPHGVFAFHTSVYILLMPVIGGIGTVLGAVLGGVIFGVVEEQLVANFPEIHLLLYGGLLIFIILVEPDGVVGLFARIWRRITRQHGRTDVAGPQPDEILRGTGGA